MVGLLGADDGTGRRRREGRSVEQGRRRRRRVCGRQRRAGSQCQSIGAEVRRGRVTVTRKFEVDSVKRSPEEFERCHFGTVPRQTFGSARRGPRDEEAQGFTERCGDRDARGLQPATGRSGGHGARRSTSGAELRLALGSCCESYFGAVVVPELRGVRGRKAGRRDAELAHRRRAFRRRISR